eukprot:8146685-Pyramimonas_sp.AAC.1
MSKHLQIIPCRRSPTPSRARSTSPWADARGDEGGPAEVREQGVSTTRPYSYAGAVERGSVRRESDSQH